MELGSAPVQTATSTNTAPSGQASGDTSVKPTGSAMDVKPSRGSPGARPSEESSKESKTTEATSTQAQAPKAAPSAELFEVKVDGKVIKMTRDELIQHASMGHAAQKRFQEAAQLRKQTEAVVGKLRDPKSVIQALQDPALGLNKDQIREAFEEWYSREFIEPEQLTPEQRKLREAEDKIRKFEEAEKSRAEEKRKAEEEAMTSQAREQLQNQIIEALDTGSLPKTNFTVRRLAYWIQRNHANGFDAPTEVLVSQVKNEFNQNMRDMVEASDGDVLIKLLGDSIIQKIRKYDLDQLRKTRQGGQVTTTQVQEETRARGDGREPLSSADVNERLRQLQRTGRY